MLKIQEKELLIEYLESKRVTEKMIEDCTDDGELKILRSILNELKFIIKWLKCGHNPTDYRGIERLYSASITNQVLEAVISESPYQKVSDDEYTDYIFDEHHICKRILKGLTDRELDAFLMVKCERLSMNEMAELLDISKGSVQKYIERLNQKIEMNIKDYEAEKLLIDSDFTMEDFKAVLQLSDYDFKQKKLNFLNQDSTPFLISDYLLRKLEKKELKPFVLTHIKNESVSRVAAVTKLKEETVIRNLNSGVNRISKILSREAGSIKD